MTLGYNVTLRNAQLDAITSAAGAGGLSTVRIKSAGVGIVVP